MSIEWHPPVHDANATRIMEIGRDLGIDDIVCRRVYNAEWTDEEDGTVYPAHDSYEVRVRNHTPGGRFRILDLDEGFVTIPHGDELIRDELQALLSMTRHQSVPNGSP